MDAITETRHIAVPAQDVKFGDYISGLRVTQVKVGRKWVYITTTVRTLEVEIGFEVEIDREFETDESKAARRAESMEEVYVSQLARWTPETPAAAAKIAEVVAKGHVVTHWDIDKLVDAQASDKVWARYAHLVAYGTEKGMTVTQVRAEFISELKGEIIQAAQYGNSRSTSAISNAVEAAELAAKAQFINRF